MTIAIAVINQKGGVGKTTTAVNLSASIAALGAKVLLMDLDAQANASTSSGINVGEIEWSIDDVFLERADLSSITCVTEFGYDIAPASYSLSRTEWQLMQEEGRELRLHDAIASLNGKYDYIIMDAPPALNILSVNAILASNELLVPVQCEFLALEGLTKLLRTIRALEKTQQRNIPFCLIRTLFDGRVRLSKQVSDELLRHFSDQVLHTVIPRSVRLAEAPSHSKPALFYDGSSQGALLYLALASEIIQKHYKNGLIEQSQYPLLRIANV